MEAKTAQERRRSKRPSERESEDQKDIKTTSTTHNRKQINMRRMKKKRNTQSELVYSLDHHTYK